MDTSLSAALAVHVAWASVWQPVGCRRERWRQAGIVRSSGYFGAGVRIGEVICCGASNTSRAVTTGGQLVSHRWHGLLETCRHGVGHA